MSIALCSPSARRRARRRRPSRRSAPRYAAQTCRRAERACPSRRAFPTSRRSCAQAKDLAKLKTATSDAAARSTTSSLALPPSMAFFANEFGHPREIVKNAPYTAEAVTESIQVLPDGNRIVRKSTTLLARDGAGRTRQERKGDGRAGVYIYDPMEGRSIVLNENTRTATRIPRDAVACPVPPEPPTPPCGAWRRRRRPRRRGRRGRIAGTSRSSPAASSCSSRGGGGQPTTRTMSGRGDPHRPRRARRTRACRRMPPLPPLTLPIVPRGKGETKIARQPRIRRHQGRRHDDVAHDPGRRDRQREARSW